VDEAQVWLAVQAETQEEAAKLKAAMHDSLALAQQEAALQQQEAHAPQAANMSEGLLRKRFAASTVLPRLDTLLPASMLFCGEPPLSTMIKTKVGGSCCCCCARSEARALGAAQAVHLQPHASCHALDAAAAVCAACSWWSCCASRTTATSGMRATAHATTLPAWQVSGWVG
jgi:hypothetical protein